MSLKTVVEHELEVLKQLDEAKENVKRLTAVTSSDVFALFPAVRQRLTLGKLYCEKLMLEMLEAISITR